MRSMRNRAVLAALAGAAIVAAAASGIVEAPGVGIRSAHAQQAQPAPVREITRIAGEVYRFRNNFHYSVFAVTPEGIIVTDPINADAARWLKAELKSRFDKPVKYLIYSHDHADHISGGEVFADTAVVVAHANAKAAIVGEGRRTAVPQIGFSEQLTIELGGTVVELAYVGRNHSDNSIVMRFPKERVAFAVDFVPVNSVAFRDFPDAYLAEWFESLRRVEAMDFDILAPGHGPLGNKTHVTAFRNYMEELRDEVLKYSRQGMPLATMRDTIRMPKYEQWAGHKEMFQLNIDGMHRMVNANRRGN